MTNNLILDDEEQEILAAFEAGELSAVPNVKQHLNQHRKIIYIVSTLQRRNAAIDALR